MRLTETASKWGNLYRFRHYVDGKRVSNHEFSVLWLQEGCTPENGKPLQNTSYGFRKEWHRP